MRFYLGPSTPVTQQNQEAPEVSGLARVWDEDFPELLNSIRETNWPPVVQDVRCDVPSTIGEDYKGSLCTGTTIAAIRNDNCQMPSSIGEDYSGPQCIPPAGNQTTVVVDLKLVHRVSEAPAQALSGTR